MDACSSGSIQSSRGGGGDGGGEEYDDSRVDSIPSFLINHPSSSNYNNYNSPSYLDAFSQPQEPNNIDHHPLSNIGLVWSNNLDSIINLPTYTKPTSTQQVETLKSQPQGQLGHFSSTTMSIRPSHQNGTGINMKNSNPRKRTRASRRAPTTILTTDASNFRAMVQEFTGIPAPFFSSPNSSAAYSYSRGLGLFGSGAAAPSSRVPILNPSPPDPIVNQEMFNMRSMQNNDQMMMPAFQSLLLQQPPRPPSNFNVRAMAGTNLQRNQNVDDANDIGSSSRGGGSNWISPKSG